MDEEETKVCPNCKREIPGVNFTTHTVHCARNIRVCPVCKEPVPLADLQRHHDELHKQMPCKQCGESVCGTDLEDHIRDSCANTIKSCRFCELELPRGELPAHEGYCGVRTEQCPDCREYVMIKYRQLHLDSNHGFIRLDDDPAPIPMKDPYKLNINRPTTSKNQPSTSNGYVPGSLFANFTRDPYRFQDRVERKISNNNEGSNSGSGSSLSEGSSGRFTGDSSGSSGGSSSSGLGTRDNRKTQNTNGVKPPLKRTNDQPQININSVSTNKVEKDLGVSRGAVKKRVAPKPPPAVPPPNPARDMPFYSALQRKQKEEKQREEQNAYNLSVGLPPVLSPAAKIEKLRKMDALQNREVVDNDYRNRLRGDIWRSGPPIDPGNIVGAGPSRSRPADLQPDAGPSKFRNKENGEPKNFQAGPSRANVPLKNINNQPNDEDVDMEWPELKNLKPMTPEEFMERFNELQLRRDGREDRVDQRADRFSEIKSSLRELRRGLNEVIAPYNANNAANNVNNGRANRRSGSASPQDVQNMQDMQNMQDVQDMQEVRLPCEFCGIAVPIDDLVQHQTGCRPDLAQYRVDVGVDNAINHNQLRQNEQHWRHEPRHEPRHEQRHEQRHEPRHEPRHEQRDPDPDPDPVIPCEFCAKSLPVYLISEHQERCGRASNLLYPD